MLYGGCSPCLLRRSADLIKQTWPFFHVPVENLIHVSLCTKTTKYCVSWREIVYNININNINYIWYPNHNHSCHNDGDGTNFVSIIEVRTKMYHYGRVVKKSHQFYIKKKKRMSLKLFWSDTRSTELFNKKVPLFNQSCSGAGSGRVLEPVLSWL